MPLHIIRDDIANMRTDAVVIPANSSLQISGGAGESVARVAGLEALQAACDKIGGCPVGRAVATPAFDFPAKMVIHAVGPIWTDGNSGESEALYSCVSESLNLAVESGAETIALPLLSTGSFGYPVGEAIDIETRAIQHFLDGHDADVWLVLYDRESVLAGRKLFADIEEYIDDVYTGKHGYEGTATLEYSSMPVREFGGQPPAAVYPSASQPQLSMPSTAAPPKSLQKRKGPFQKRKKRKRKQQLKVSQAREEYEASEEQPQQLENTAVTFNDVPKGSYFESPSDMAASFPTLREDALFSADKSQQDRGTLENWLAQLDESFASTVLKLIDERGMTDVEVYKRANMSRQLFAKIRKDDDYRPTKKTACALAFALELNYSETLALLSRAGFTLSHSSKFDVIIEYFLVNDVHDIFQVNEALFAYDQPILG